jgi:hypothetical protein
MKTILLKTAMAILIMIVSSYAHGQINSNDFKSDNLKLLPTGEFPLSNG